jgi:Ca2+-binding RTX toxin-like protein
VAAVGWPGAGRCGARGFGVCAPGKAAAKLALWAAAPRPGEAAAGVRAGMGAQGWTHERPGVGELLRSARDEAHFHLLRLGEAVRDRWPEDGADRVRRAMPAALGVVVVAVAISVAWPHAERAGWFGGVSEAAQRPAPGTPRADTIIGGAGSDELVGGSGADVVTGGAGADRIFGGAGSDTLHGGLGNDQLWASGGQDVLFGGAGDDVLYAQALDGVDRLLCGTGTDVAYVSRVNGVIRDRMVGCERVVVNDYEVRRARR